MASSGECPGRRSGPVSKLSLLVGLAEPFTSSAGDASSSSPSRSTTPRSPRSFDYDGAVGLGIVAAMNPHHPRAAAPTITRAPPPRSAPIPIASGAGARPPRIELSESYTCVTSHLGGGAAVRKRVYLDDGGGGCSSAVLFETTPGAPEPAPGWPAEDFLSRCFCCRKNLHGLDIFMYRGDRAFCSAECRCQQMISDELREKCVPDAHKPFECSPISPCSTPLFFAAGVAAA